MGCASMGPRRLTPEYQAIRQDLNGFSILPPQGKGWVQMPDEPYKLVFGKELEPGHTFVAMVEVVESSPTWKDPEGYLKAIQAGKNADIDPRRFKVLAKEFVLDKKFGAYCLRFHLIAEDHQAEHKGAGGFAVMEAWGYGALHPQHPRWYFDVSFSERNEPGKGDPSASSAAQQFLNGFAFRDTSVAQK